MNSEEIVTSNQIDERSPEQILQRLEWRVIKRLDGLLQGDYRTLFYGTGIDFADLREYQVQDDIRHIDWNVTARMDTPYVRQYVEDREITAWFLLDMSSSMNFGPADRPKEQILVDLVGTLARLLTRDGNRVGAILYTDRVEAVIPARGGRNQVLRLMRELLLVQPSSSNTSAGDEEQPSLWKRLFARSDRSTISSKKVGGKTDLAALLRAGLSGVGRRSLVFVLSDFISEPGWERSLSLLARKHELVAVRLWDSREAVLPDAGQIVVEDAETGEYLFVDTGDPAFRERFVAMAAQREAELATAMRRAGTDLFDVSTEEDVMSALVRMASLRKRRRV